MDCTTEDNLAYYSLEGLRADTDYVVKSPLSSHEFILNICRPVKSQLWNVQHLAEDQVGAFYHGKHGDIAIGSINSTLATVDGNPVLYMHNGSPCKEKTMLANTAIRFICDTTSLFDDGAPQLIAQFPTDDDSACAFYFEWRTRHACPVGQKPAGILHLFLILLSFIPIMFLLYVGLIFIYNRFFLGLRGRDALPSLGCFSPIRFFTWLHDKITGRGDGFVGGPGLRFGNGSNGVTSGGRWGFSGGSSNGGGSRWGWGKWGRRSHSNGYGRIPEEEQGILENDRDSFDGADEENTPRGVNGDTFDNAWAGARSGMNSDGIIRL
ncbi:hypothetical protein M408DRAFT_327198 [Serendipita vermifera MAFF 305830]|uniref:MRH domain-containing protein n=1 Tax=Serendipita vermifera MAFF 305830 TaxID=933852 RepID=A0A0C2X0D4_SERVB|nr:hypothetical protein M408DRAFT_327198 [Serendipita vermifera MAFF 305830]